MKNRLVGALVISALAVIFVPPILENPKDYGSHSAGYVPSPPPVDQALTPHLLPPEDEEPLIPPQSLEQGETLSPAAAPTEIATKLPGQSTENPQPEQDLTSWVVKLGSFSNPRKAEKLKQDLRKKDFPAFITISQTGNNTSLLLQVGPILSKNNAEIIAAEVARQFKVTGEIVQYP